MFVVGYFPTVSETFIVNQINGLIDAGLVVKLYAYKKVDAEVIHHSINRYDLLNNVQYFIKPPNPYLKRITVFFNWILLNRHKANWRVLFKTLNVFKYGKDAYSLKLFFESQWFLIETKIDVVHAHFGMYGNRIAYLKHQGILPNTLPLITTFHGYDLVPSRLQEYTKNYRYLWKHADAFTVNTPYLGNLLSNLNKYRKPTYTIPVGIDTDFFIQNESKTENTYFDVVFCGKLIYLKGPDTAIDILYELHRNGNRQVRLHFIGNGVMRNELELMVEHYKLNDFVYFYGNLTQEEVRAQFEKCDVLIMPGRYDLETGRAETQGLVIQEAQAMGLPVIVSNVGGMKYGLLPDESGFVVDEGDINGFVDAVETLINNPELIEIMGSKGVKFVKEHYDENILVDRLINIMTLT
jgi:colanic acid/amylovoran biosynthesis glycosyltransferase